MNINSQKIFAILSGQYKPTKAFLDYKTPYQLMVAVILSAQCTDKLVNKVTPALFKAFPDAPSMASAPLKSIQMLVKSVNYNNTKAKNINKMSQQIIDIFNEIIPETMEELITLAGIGRKSANVILGHIYNMPAISVDTHVKRLVNRMGFINEKDPTKIELKLKEIWPEEIQFHFSTILIMHGREICKAKSPQCEQCCVNKLCEKQQLAT
jgi:endonuclease III